MNPLTKIVVYWLIAMSLAVWIMLYTSTAQAGVGWFGFGGGFYCHNDIDPAIDRFDRPAMEDACISIGAPLMSSTLVYYGGWDGVGDSAPLPPISTREPEVLDQFLDDGYRCMIFQGGPPYEAEVPPEVNRWDAPQLSQWCATFVGPEVPAIGVFRVLRIFFATDTAALSWTPPTENEDGTPLTDLCCYKIYYGQNPFLLFKEAEVNDSLANSKNIEIGVGQWYFEATAIDTSDNESRRSNQASKEFRP